MMKKLLILLLFLIKSSIGGFASTGYTTFWQKANKFYDTKEYDSAAYYYEKITTSNPDDAVVYYNLGNTYYRLNLIGPAVLNYERAIRLNPSYKEAKDNLLLTQARIPNRIQGIPEIFFVQWWHTVTHGTKAGLWALICLLLFLSTIGILLAKRFNKLEQVPPQLTIALSITWLVSLVFAFTSANNKIDSKRGVVMQPDAPFMINPQSNKPQSLVPEGTTVKWKSDTENWVETTLPDGRKGWMQKAMLIKI